MPRLNEKGPMGYGRQTGRGFGRCNDFQGTGNPNLPGQGRRRGNGQCNRFGEGMGSGRNNRWNHPDMPQSRQDEQHALEVQMEALTNQLNIVKQRLEECKAGNQDK